MVDLVKIRKKAKSGAAPASGAEVAAVATIPVATEKPAAEAAAAPLSVPETDKLARFKEQAGQRRAVATRTEQTTTEQQLELLSFLVAGEQYALDIENIVEIVRPRPVTRIPNADPSVVGIISLRGTIVTLLDVRRKLKHGTQNAPTEDTRVIVVDRGGETIGFEVDHVLRVVKIAAGALEPHPVVHTSELDDAIRGVFRLSGALTILLDFDKLLHSAA